MTEKTTAKRKRTGDLMTTWTEFIVYATENGIKLYHYKQSHHGSVHGKSPIVYLNEDVEIEGWADLSTKDRQDVINQYFFSSPAS